MKVLLLSSIGFDTNLSLIKAIKDKCDVNYMFELRTNKPNWIGVYRHLKKDIYSGNEIPEMERYKNYLPLEKTFIVNSCNYKKIVVLVKKQIQVYKTIKDIHPDIIHCYNELPPVFFFFLLLNKKNIVLTVHDPIQHYGEDTWIKRIMRVISFACIKKYILLNVSQKEEFMNCYKAKHSDVFFSSLGIYEYLNDYIQRPVKKPNNNDFHFLFFGRISPYKGIRYLLEAFVMMQKDGISNITLTIAGEGKYSFNLSNYVNNRQITIINKFLSASELANLINESSVVVCPYIDATQSGVVMSSFALAKPVIATNVGGLPEMVDDKHTGLIVPPKDAGALKDAMMTLYKDPDLLLRMSAAIQRKYVSGASSWNRITDGLLDIYKDIANTTTHSHHS